MALKVINRQASVIDRSLLYRQCRIDPELDGTHEDDPLLDAYLEAAVILAEHRTERAVGEQQLELALDGFPADAIELPKGPVISVQDVSYRNTLGAEVHMPPGGFVLDNYGTTHWLVAGYGLNWPQTLEAANSVVVRYTAGDVPPAVRHALLLIVADWYANREDSADKSMTWIPNGARALLNTQRVWGL